ncbi:hypothetical protein CcaCcLH18_03208 [Colletotrichum camelliae]|nr:hypothetical protein CcaCcLH18_03208 [Colletotrichum camelliae]
MATKRDSGEWAGPRRLPSVREKLSGFVKRGRGLAKKSTLSLIGERSQRPSLDESQKALPRVEVQAFGTSSLEIDLTSLEAFRDVPMPPPPQKKPEQQQPPPTTSSMTPIADMFSAKRTPLTEPSPANNYSLNKSSPSLIDALKISTRAEDRRSSTITSQTAQTSDPVTNVTVINLTHSVPHTAKPWPPPEKPRAAASNRLQANKASDSKQPGRIQLREPRRAAFVPSGPVAINMPPMSRPRLNADIASEIAEKRYSTPTGMSSLGAAPTSVPAETIRSDRRRSWQPAPTSVPSGSSTPSAPPSASAPWRNGLGNRRISPRLATDRLAWIKELEEGKKKSSINGDIPVLKSVQGSVADKLARFEQKQQQQQLAPLTRSNSTRSRNSSVADTTFSSYGGPATSRSSLDSHRASSVFSHYDDTFREKMELVAGRKGDEEAEERPALQKVTTSFVSIGKKDKQASVDMPQAAEEPKDVENAEDVEKTGDAEKVADIKVEEPQVEEPKIEEPQAEVTKVEEPQTESVKETEDVENVDDVKVEDVEKAVEAEKVEDVQKIENTENVKEVQNVEKIEVAEEVQDAEKVELVEDVEKVETIDVPQVVEEVPEVVASKDVAEVQVADKVDAANEPREIDAAQPVEEPQAI